MFRFFLLFILLLAQPIFGATKEPPLIKRKTLFSEEAYVEASLSHDGKHLSFVTPFEGTFNIWLQDIDRKTPAKPLTTFKGHPVWNYVWAHNNEYILISRDQDGDEQTHILVLDINTSEIKDLTPFPKTKAYIVAASRFFPDEIVVAINNRDPRFHDLWKIDIRTGKRELLFQNDEQFGELYVDHSHTFRIGKKSDGEGGFNLFLRNTEDNSFELFDHFSRDDACTSRLLNFSKDNKTLYYLDSRESNTSALYASTLDPKNREKRRLFSDEKSDIQSVFFDSLTEEPLAVRTSFLKPEWTLLQKSIHADFDYLRSFSEGFFHMYSDTHDDTKWIVIYSYDTKPSETYIYDRDTKKLSFLFSRNKELNSVPLSPMKPLIITSRDGLPLVSYLTLPEKAPKKPLPMVLLVHGGPWCRDQWGLNSYHQWLSNRGYAVLSVNYRGSSGFGKEFINAGNRQWAKNMHNDLIDAVQWSIKAGIADPHKVAIMGGSYGGYATLVGVTFTPGVFACGVDLFGVSDVETHLQSVHPYLEDYKDFLSYRVGSLQDKAFLKSISPLSKVDQISKPLLILQGSNDVRVKEAQSTYIVDKMKQKNIPVVYVLFPDEGHGFCKKKNSLASYAITELFLAHVLGGRYEPVGQDIENSSAIIKEGQDIINNLELKK